MMVSFAILASLLVGLDVKPGLAYKTVGEIPVLMDLHLPETPLSKPMPVVVMIHGGAWISGSRNEMTPLAAELAKRGVAVANIDYRLGPKDKWPAMIDDCRDAVAYVKRHAAEYDLDANRIGAIGGSAGGHLALLLGFTDVPTGPDKVSTRVKAVVNLFGPVDLTQDFAAGLANLVSTQVLGKKYEEAAEEAKAFSPITYVDGSSCPVYTLHGSADPLVPVVQSQRLDDAMKAAGRSHTRVVVEGMGHGVSAKDIDLDKKVKEELGKALDWLVAQLSGQ